MRHWGIVQKAVAAVAVIGLAACSSGGSGSSGSAADWNKSRTAYTKAQVATAIGVLDRLAKAGVKCDKPGEEQFTPLVESYTKQDLPLPAGAASCVGPNDENLLVEVFNSAKYPTGADFMARKRAIICKKALELGKQPNGKKNDFPGMPYVIAKDKSWVLEPDSFEVNRQIAKALGLKSIDACAGVKV